AATLATTSLVVLLGFAVASSWYRTERALLADAFDRIEESQADSDRMAADLADIRGRIAAAPDAPARLELVERAEELEELLSVERELRAGLVNAALGFSIGSDDDRARALARKRLFDDLDGALAVGNFVRIEVLAERFVASSGGMNPLRLSDAEVARLRSLLELAREKNLERRRDAVAGATDPVPAPPTDALP
ncbi:MAG TPA: hypothetical protein VLA66_05205, partial [Thermoanaerobaculia bacterium]|nr:hypothetical protein [Thermoanaerobaculia bacterium]